MATFSSALASLPLSGSDYPTVRLSGYPTTGCSLMAKLEGLSRLAGAVRRKPSPLVAAASRQVETRDGRSVRRPTTLKTLRVVKGSKRRESKEEEQRSRLPSILSGRSNQSKRLNTHKVCLSAWFVNPKEAKSNWLPLSTGCTVQLNAIRFRPDCIRVLWNLEEASE